MNSCVCDSEKGCLLSGLPEPEPVNSSSQYRNENYGFSALMPHRCFAFLQQMQRIFASILCEKTPCSCVRRLRGILPNSHSRLYNLRIGISIFFGKCSPLCALYHKRPGRGGKHFPRFLLLKAVFYCIFNHECSHFLHSYPAHCSCRDRSIQCRGNTVPDL